MLHHPCILGDPQQKGQNQSGPKRGRKCYITPAFSGIPNKGDKIKAGPKEGGNATSPLHSRGSPKREINQSRPKRGRKCYITPAFSGVPNKGDKIKAGPKEGKNATSALHSRGSPNKWGQNQNWLPKPCLLGAHKWAEMLRQPCILGGPQQRGQNQSGPKRAQKCYITPAFSGIPRKGDKSKQAQKRAEMLHHPYILGGPQQGEQNQSGPKRGRKCYITPAFSGIPSKGDKSKRAQKRAEMLRHPCILGGPQQRGQNQSGPKRGRKCYITPAFSGIPNKGDKIKAGPKEGGNATSPLHSRGSPAKKINQSGPKRGRKCYITPAFWGVPNRGDKIKAGPKEGKNATSPLHSRGSPAKGTKSKRAQKRAEMLHHPCILGGPQQRGQNQSGPKRGRKCYITPAFSGIPSKGDKSKQAQKRAEMLHHPCILGGPQQRGQNQSGPKRGRKCYITPAFSGIPNKRDKIKAGPKEGGNATSPLHSRGSPKREINQSRPKRGRKCYITPAFSGVPNKGDKIKAGPKDGRNATSALHSRGSPNKWGQNQNWLPKPCLLGAHKWAEMLRQPCILGGPQQRGQNQSGPKRGQKCCITPYILGVPQTNGDKIRIGCLNPAFWGPKRGRKCYVNLAFSGVPNKGDKIKAGPKEGGNATSLLHSRGSPAKEINQSRHKR